MFFMLPITQSILYKLCYLEVRLKDIENCSVSHLRKVLALTKCVLDNTVLFTIAPRVYQCLCHIKTSVSRVGKLNEDRLFSQSAG
jgi:hypothetical protein